MNPIDFAARLGRAAFAVMVTTPSELGFQLRCRQDSVCKALKAATGLALRTWRHVNNFGMPLLKVRAKRALPGKQGPSCWCSTPQRAI
jgi:hypothetical protein